MGNLCVSKKRIGGGGESTVLRAEKSGGVVVACVIPCGRLNGLLISEKTQGVVKQKKYSFWGFFFRSFKMCKHFIFAQGANTNGRVVDMSVRGCDQCYQTVFCVSDLCTQCFTHKVKLAPLGKTCMRSWWNPHRHYEVRGFKGYMWVTSVTSNNYLPE